MYFTRGITVNGVTFAEHESHDGQLHFCIGNHQAALLLNDRTGRKVSAVLANLNTRTFGQCLSLSSLACFTWTPASEQDLVDVADMFARASPKARLPVLDLNVLANPIPRMALRPAKPPTGPSERETASSPVIKQTAMPKRKAGGKKRIKVEHVGPKDKKRIKVARPVKPASKHHNVVQKQNQPCIQFSVEELSAFVGRVVQQTLTGPSGSKCTQQPALGQSQIMTFQQHQSPLNQATLPRANDNNMPQFFSFLGNRETAQLLDPMSKHLCRAARVPGK